MSTSGGVGEALVTSAQAFARPEALPQLELSPPPKLGRVVDYFNSPSGGQKLIVLIQDLHAHYGVQKNIAEILDFLTSKLSRSGDRAVPFALGVEGAEGPIDSSILAQFPDRALKRQALDFLMREGELTGMEYFSAMRGLPRHVVGVEDERYYEAHRELFRQTYESRQRLVVVLREIQSEIHSLRDRVYSGGVKDIQSHVDAHEKGLTSTDDFVAFLVARSRPSDLERLPDLRAYFANSKANVQQAEQLRSCTAQFLKDSADRLSGRERATLAALAKKQGTSAYFDYLRSLVHKHELFMSVPLELAKHMEYLHTLQTTGFDRVLEQAEQRAEDLKRDAAKSQPERDLIEVERDLSLLLKLTDLQATEYQVRAFGPRIGQFVALCQSLLRSHGLRSIDERVVRDLISTSIDYYAMALTRNKRWWLTPSA